MELTFELEPPITIDTAEFLMIFIEEHERQVYRQDYRLKRIKYTCDYSVTYKRRLLCPRWPIRRGSTPLIKTTIPRLAAYDLVSVNPISPTNANKAVTP